jgi:hypothetical protein
MSDQELTQRLIFCLTQTYNLSETDRRALSMLSFRFFGESIRIQGEYGLAEEHSIRTLWPQITDTLFNITGCRNIIDNRIFMEQRKEESNHCITYITDGAHKPLDWEYVPVRELSENDVRRAQLFGGSYVRVKGNKRAESFPL